MTNNILSQRIEIDLQLGLLRREYKLKGHRWNKQRQDEQKANQVAASKAKQELLDHQHQATEHAAGLHEQRPSFGEAIGCQGEVEASCHHVYQGRCVVRMNEGLLYSDRFILIV